MRAEATRSTPEFKRALVSLNGRAPALQAGHVGSIPITRSTRIGTSLGDLPLMGLTLLELLDPRGQGYGFGLGAEILGCGLGAATDVELFKDMHQV
jgi:hypothetical protein